MQVGTTAIVGSSVGTTATGRTPSRIQVHPAPMPAPLVEMGSTVHNVADAALDRLADVGTATQVD